MKDLFSVLGVGGWGINALVAVGTFTVAIYWGLGNGFGMCMQTRYLRQDMTSIGKTCSRNVVTSHVSEEFVAKVKGGGQLRSLPPSKFSNRM